MNQPSTRRYPRWVKCGRSELFYRYHRSWIFELHHGSEHPMGSHLVIRGGQHACRLRFLTSFEAKTFCEAKNQKEIQREKFDFPLTPIPRVQRGLQSVVLPCPVLHGMARHGWLKVRWHLKSASLRWSYGQFDACYPQCDRFDDLLDQSNWDRELIRRMIDAGEQWEQITRTCMRWNYITAVPHDIAQWTIDTLPGVYAEACNLFASRQGQTQIQ